MNRISLLNYLIRRYSYDSYLEVGCQDDECFSRIDVRRKVGVDPERGGTLRLTSDAFFRRNYYLFWRREYFDLIFIDGQHFSGQVVKDIKNSLKILKKDGTIMVHDCNPQREEEAVYPHAGTSLWNGDVWKAFVYFRQDRSLDMVTSDFDYGCGIIQVRPNSFPIRLSKPYSKMAWSDLVENSEQWLRIKTFDKIKEWLK